MIIYANDLIKEIQDNKPSEATTITMCGATIDSVRYTGVALDIKAYGVEFVEKSEFDYLQEEYDYIESQTCENEQRNEELENALIEIKRLLDKEEKVSDETIDEIYDIIKGVDVI